MKAKSFDQQGTHRTRKSTVKKRLNPYVTTKNRNNNKRQERSKSGNRVDTTTLSSRRTRSQQIRVGTKSPVFQITVHRLKRYKHRYHCKCIVIPCAHRFSTVRDWNNHHRNFHKTILNVVTVVKDLEPPVLIEIMCTCINNSNSLAGSATKSSAFQVACKCI